MCECSSTCEVRDGSISDADRIVREVEQTIRAANAAKAGLDEFSFLKGAMAAFLAIYGERDGRLPLAPPKWVISGMRGESIFKRRGR